ncbi:MAG: hypothetical protein KKB81_02260 [Candidatus Margulisbacteria bacterium]|nr:hypothetical protein [Candidatus Margulisiibacteriota bacterium]MBU1022606.1 hypothetical protein [Candidatus Margulisiibacteriota bacterium]MBU1728892.1 hypothetical protein [Candidatus Margulisiibacteriota bacterium]MBU1955524.1 hypothetical protein [Candidatus Margulisiibacteriota bacterium]
MSIGMILQPISIVLEFIALILGVMIAVQKKKGYGWCIALVFAIYVFYDAVKFINSNQLAVINISADLLYILFFIATVSILWVVWQVYRGR